MTETTPLQIQITGMSCGSCVGRVQSRLQREPGVLDASVNLATSSALLLLEGTKQPESILPALQEIGYDGAIIQPGHHPERAQAAKVQTTYGQRALLTLLLGLPVIVVEMGGHFVPAFSDLLTRTLGAQTLLLLSFLLTSVVLLGPGRDFFRLGLPALIYGRPDMNSLVALGVLTAFGFSSVAVFAPWILPEGSVNVYFESAVIIVLFILIGRYLEARAKGQAGAAIAALIGLQPKTAQVKTDAGFVETLLENLRPGDLLQLRPGEKVAVDGTVQEGQSFVDESMLTGEALPVQKALGTQLVAGSINGHGALVYRADKVGADTVLAQIIEMVETAQGAKLPIQNMIDRITSWFVPMVLLAAALTCAAWLIWGTEPALNQALVNAAAVLIIACPCAMGLAVPISIVVATGRASQDNILFRKGDALQRLADVGLVGFDKTGTLTEGRPEVMDISPANGWSEADVLRFAAAAEANSEHPIARAILSEARARNLESNKATEFEATPGQGLRARLDGYEILLGNAGFLHSQGIALAQLEAKATDFSTQGKTVVFIAIDGEPAGLISVVDQLKPSAITAIKALRAKGVQIAMITGDTAQTAQVIAQKLGIEHVIAGVLPAGKVAGLTALVERRATSNSKLSTAFVGDGINDAPVLAAADVGIAIGSGTDVAIEAADVVLASADLMGVARALDISQRTMRNIRQNLIWAFGYNILLIPVAAGVLFPFGGPLLSPMLAAGAMALSSVFVVCNALRLRLRGAALVKTA